MKMGYCYLLHIFSNLEITCPQIKTITNYLKVTPRMLMTYVHIPLGKKEEKKTPNK